jgi:predicted nucleic acid-binding protein
MPSEPGSIYLDANVLLAYVGGEENRVEVVEQILSDAAEGKVSLVTSTLSIVEVAYAAGEVAIDGGEETEDAIDALWTPASPILLVEPSVAVMRRARGLLRQAKAMSRSLKPADAVHLATAATAPGVGALVRCSPTSGRARGCFGLN